MSLDLTPGINHGSLVEVVEAEGTGLVGDHAIGATVLTVAAGGFRNAGQCRLAGNVYTYVREGDSLAITPPLVAAVDDGTPVESLTPNGDAETRLLAVVDLDMIGEENESADEAEDLPRAWIPGEVAGYYPVGTAAAGAIVNVRDTAYGHQVVGRPTDAPGLDQGVIDTPYITLYQAGSVSWPDSTSDDVLDDWSVNQQVGIDFDPATSEIVFLSDGLYALSVAVRWAGNSSGRRYIQIVTNLGVDIVLRSIGATPPDAQTFSQQITVLAYPALAGERARVKAHQTSGASLDMVGDAAGRFVVFQAVRLQA